MNAVLKYTMDNSMFLNAAKVVQEPLRGLAVKAALVLTLLLQALV